MTVLKGAFISAEYCSVNIAISDTEQGFRDEVRRFHRNGGGSIANRWPFTDLVVVWTVPFLFFFFFLFCAIGSCMGNRGSCVVVMPTLIMVVWTVPFIFLFCGIGSCTENSGSYVVSLATLILVVVKREPVMRAALLFFSIIFVESRRGQWETVGDHGRAMRTGGFLLAME